MCTEDVYTDIYPDGRRAEHVRPNLCERSRHGQVCDRPVVYQHPPRYLQPGEAHAAYPYPATILPPSPRQTPRATTPNHYRSGDESDRSHHSSSSAERRHHHRRSGEHRERRTSGVYVNGHKVLDLDAARGTGAAKPSRAGASGVAVGDRIVIVDSPPTQRTPPQQFNMPYTVPPSPNVGAGGPLGYNIVEAHATAPRGGAHHGHHHRHSSGAGGAHRPVIVDERPRPRVQIEVVNTSRPSKHARQPSNDSRHSHSSSGNNNNLSSDEERRRAARRREDRIRAEEELKRQKIRARIAAANDEIQRRQPVPVPRAPPGATTTTAAAATAALLPSSKKTAPAYVRPAVEIASPADRERELVDAVRKLDLESRRRAAAAAAAAGRAEREEDEAQRQRLMERMQPRRRATVGPGSRRHRVLYDDGLYRWE